MWLLIFIIFSGPETLENLEILKTFQSKSGCLQEMDRAIKVGLPKRSSISCVNLSGVYQIERQL